MIRTAFLPSAGLGARLRPLTDHTPKPLLPVCGEPLIHHVMKHCREIGVERFIINTSHLPEAFEAAFPNRSWEGLPVELVREPIRLETGAGLKNIEPLLDPSEPLLVYNSDILTDLRLSDLVTTHQDLGRPVATLAASRKGSSLFLVADSDNRLQCVDRRPTEETVGRFQFLGIAVVENPLFAFLQKEEPESVVNGWARAIATDPAAIRICEMGGGRWKDVGSRSAYESARDFGLTTDSLSIGETPARQ